MKSCDFCLLFRYLSADKISNQIVSSKLPICDIYESRLPLPYSSVYSYFPGWAIMYVVCSVNVFDGIQKIEFVLDSVSDSEESYLSTIFVKCKLGRHKRFVFDLEKCKLPLSNPLPCIAILLAHSTI